MKGQEHLKIMKIQKNLCVGDGVGWRNDNQTLKYNLSINNLKYSGISSHPRFCRRGYPEIKK